jgi:hypothetical protein
MFQAHFPGTSLRRVVLEMVVTIFIADANGGVARCDAQTECQQALQLYLKSLQRSRDSAVGTATDYGLDDGGVGVLVPV